MPVRKGKTGETAAMGARIIDKHKKVVSAPQPESDSEGDIGALRKEIDSLKAKVAEVAKKVTSRAAEIPQQAEATVRRRPLPTLLIAAAAATAVALLVSRATAVPRRSRYRRLVDELPERLADLRMLR